MCNFGKYAIACSQKPAYFGCIFCNMQHILRHWHSPIFRRYFVLAVCTYFEKTAINQHACIAELSVIINFHTTCLTAELHYVGQLHNLCAITVQPEYQWINVIADLCIAVFMSRVDVPLECQQVLQTKNLWLSTDML